MSTLTAFGLVIGFVLAGSAATALVLRSHLGRLLDELCGSPARSGFWLTLSLLVIVLAGVLAGSDTGGYPDGTDPNTHDVLLGAVTQVRFWLLGLLGSLLLVALALFRSVQHFEARADRVARAARFQAGNPQFPAQPPQA